MACLQLQSLIQAGRILDPCCRLNLTSIVAISKKKKLTSFHVDRCHRKISLFSVQLNRLCRSAHASFQRLALGVIDVVVPSSLDFIESAQAVKRFGV